MLGKSHNHCAYLTRHFRFFHRVSLALSVILAFWLSACGEQLPPKTLAEKQKTTSDALIVQAKWNADLSRLEVAGLAALEDSKVSVKDAETGQVLANVTVNDKDQQWIYTDSELTSIPCTVIAESESLIESAVVQKVPNAFCRQNELAAQLNSPPLVKIVNPAQDLLIVAGSAVYFSAAGLNKNTTEGLHYHWDFDGRLEENRTPVPGNIVFSEPGAYRVQLTARNAQGVISTNVAERIISVRTLVDNQPPVAIIEVPSKNLNITAGDVVPSFIGTGYDVDSVSGLSYRWDFGGAAPVQYTATPGPVKFDQPGDYLVTLTVKDGLGLVDPTPAVRAISVTESLFAIRVTPGQNLPPESIIEMPATDVTIAAGEGVSFAGFGVDPNDDVLDYIWRFDRVAPGSNLAKPGVIVFNQPGTYAISFTTSDQQGLADPTPARRTISVIDTSNVVANVAPNGTIISPFQDMTIAPNDAIHFAAIGNDPDRNTPLTFAWDFQGEPTNVTTQNPGSVSFTTPGIYTVSLTVTDSLGLLDETPSQRIITVVNQTEGGGNGSNMPPTGQIRTPVTDQVININESVFFTGDGSDPDLHLPLSYAWDFSGAIAELSMSPENRDPGNITFTQAGVYTVTLNVQDNLGVVNSTPASVVITVQDPNVINNMPPYGSIALPVEDVFIHTGQTVNFLGVGIDPDDPMGSLPLSYLWDFGGGADNSSLKYPGNISFNHMGKFTVSMTVMDSTGLADPNPPRVMVTVLDPNNRVPTGTIDVPNVDLTIAVGTKVHFAGSGFDPEDNLPLQFVWTVVPLGTTSGGAPGPLTGPSGDLTFLQNGIFQVELQVTDSTGLPDPNPKTRFIVVTDGTNPGGVPLPPPVPDINQPPNGVIVSPTQDINVSIGQPVAFIGEGSDPDGIVPLSFYWDFSGYASTSTAQSPGSVTFNKAGRVLVTLTVTDEKLLADPTPPMVVVTVTDNVPPEGMIVTPISDVFINVGDAVVFEGAGLDWEGNQALNYTWDFDGYEIPPGFTSMPSPGAVVFNTAGMFVVTLTVTDRLGLSDPTPDQRMIMVADLPPSTP